MFRRPGESPFQAFVRNNRETRQRNMGGKYWQDQQKKQNKPVLKDFTRQRRQQLTPSATIRAVRPEFDVEHDSIKGMDIHLAFSVFNGKNRTFTAAAHYFLANGVPLRDKNGSYCATDGTVCVWRECKPGLVYIGLQSAVLFMPYSELHMRSGNHNLQFVASIWDDQRRRLASSDWYQFTLQVA